MTYNSVKSVRFVQLGTAIYAPVQGGVARQVADEDGYSISLADSCIWLPESLLRQARAGISGGAGGLCCMSTAGPEAHPERSSVTLYAPDLLRDVDENDARAILAAIRAARRAIGAPINLVAADGEQVWP